MSSIVRFNEKNSKILLLVFYILCYLDEFYSINILSYYIIYSYIMYLQRCMTRLYVFTCLWLDTNNQYLLVKLD